MSYQRPITRLLTILIAPALLWVYFNFDNFLGGLAYFAYTALILLSGLAMLMCWTIYGNKKLYRYMCSLNPNGERDYLKARLKFKNSARLGWQAINYLVDVGMIAVLFHYGKYIIGSLTLLQLVFALGTAAALLKGTPNDDNRLL